MSRAQNFEVRPGGARLRRRVTWAGGGHERLGPREEEERIHLADNVFDGQTARSSGQHIQQTADNQERVAGGCRDAPPSAGSRAGTYGWQGTSTQPLSVSATQIRRITEEWDETLLERTQLRHLLDTLRSSRGFLESTLQGLDNWSTRAKSHAAPSADRAAAKANVFTGDPHDHIGPTDPAIVGTPENLPSPPAARPGGASTETGSEKDRSLSYGSLLGQYRQDCERVRGLERDFSLALESLSQPRVSHERKADSAGKRSQGLNQG